MSHTPNSHKHLPVINLIGDELENFYQLGVKDRENFFAVHEHIKSIFRPNIPMISTVLETTLEELFKRKALPFGQLTPLLDSYAQGLDFPAHQLQLSLLLPELMSSLHAWLPSMKNFLLGCSSLFMLDENNEQVIHGRILDFPLMGTYDKHERAIRYQLNGQNQVFAYGCPGIPFAAITGMNDKGITLAIHQKFTNIFNKNGESIFEIGHRILSQASSKKDIFDMLEDMETITAWNLNIGLPDGEVLEVDFLGDHFHYTEHKLEKGDFLYINNQLLERESPFQNHIPYGLDYYNQARERASDHIIKSLSNKKANSKNLLMEIGSHPFKLYENEIPILTPSSVMVTTMHPSNGESLFICGEAPKEVSNGVLSFSNIWNELEEKEVKTKKKYSEKELSILAAKKYFMQAQVDYDTKDFPACYHNIQMAMDLADGSPIKHLAEFYFLIFQVLLENDKRVLSQIAVKLKKVSEGLPGILPDQAKLFLFRIEKIISGKHSYKVKDFDHPKIQDIFQFEEKIPQFMLHQVIRNSSLPRIDLLDIIYLYGKL